jgi:hypothetical protein
VSNKPIPNPAATDCAQAISQRRVGDCYCDGCFYLTPLKQKAALPELNLASMSDSLSWASDIKGSFRIEEPDGTKSADRSDKDPGCIQLSIPIAPSTQGPSN